MFVLLMFCSLNYNKVVNHGLVYLFQAALLAILQRRLKQKKKPTAFSDGFADQLLECRRFTTDIKSGNCLYYHLLYGGCKFFSQMCFLFLLPHLHAQNFFL